MFWSRWFGKILLAAVVIGIASWATNQKLLNLAPMQFWAMIIGYLAVAESLWLWLDRRSAETDFLAPRGLSRLRRQPPAPAKAGDWFYAGGRVRLADILARSDTSREYVAAVLAAVLAADGQGRLHVLSSNPGTGRSTLLLRIGQSLADKGHDVLRLLPGAFPDVLEGVLHEAGRNRPLFLLIDDLDLLPQGPDLLYGLLNSGRPVTIVATTLGDEQPEGSADALQALRPADLPALGVRHEVHVTPQDLSALAAKLSSLNRSRRGDATAETPVNYLSALDYLQDADNAEQWERASARDVPDSLKLMIALAGAAEVGLPEALLTVLGDSVKPLVWQKAGVVALESGLALPPHRNVCLALLNAHGSDTPEVAQALSRLVDKSLEHRPAFAPRLLYGLARVRELRALVTDEVSRRAELPARKGLPAGLRRQWLRVWEALGLEPTDGWGADDHAPIRWLRARALMTRGEYESAFEAYGVLRSDRVYRDLACLNRAVALAHLGRFDEAEGELNELHQRLPGVGYLRGVIAEKRGDLMAALDWYEDARKQGELAEAASRRLAFTHLRSGSPRAAIPLFESLLAAAPRAADLYGGLAVAHLHSGTSQRAVAQSARAIQAGVHPSEARKAVAHAFREVNAYERMATELEAVVSYDLNDREAWDELATACHWLGRFAREEQCLNHLQRCQGNEVPDTMLRLARCKRDEGRAEDALEILLKLTESPEPLPAALLLSAEVAGTCGRRDRQREFAQQTLSRGDDSGWGWYWLADALPAEDPEARRAYHRALQLLQARQAQGVPPRQGATMWQGIWVAAMKLGDPGTAEGAKHHARQEAMVCKALGSEIESVRARRSVPPDVFLDEFPEAPSGGGSGPSGTPIEAPRPAAPTPASPRTTFVPSRIRGRGGLKGG